LAPPQKLARFVKDNMLGGVNGTFFSGAKPAGPVINQGAWVAPKPVPGVVPPSPRSFLAYNKERSRFLVKEVTMKAETLQAGDTADKWLQRFVSTDLGFKVDEGIGGLARLLAGGRDCHRSYAAAVQKFTDPVTDNVNARTVAGVSDDGSKLIVLVQERIEEDGKHVRGTGARLGELATILKGLGAPNDAVVLDSGGSSQIVIRRDGVLTDSRAPYFKRDLPTAILF
jgi:hypothetical protein